MNAVPIECHFLTLTFMLGMECLKKVPSPLGASVPEWVEGQDEGWTILYPLTPTLPLGERGYWRSRR
jgi:hypothetical protein